MSLKKMSYNTAKKIVDIYSLLLVNMGKPSEFKIYGYSELQGYTILDVDNALKIIIAYNAFNRNKDDSIALNNLKTYSSNAGAAVFSFWSSFVPDEVIPEIDKLDSNDKSSIIKFYNLIGNYEDSEIYQTFKHQETHESFLNFCLSLSRSDSDFWEKIYNRLNITWDTKDGKDPIYLIITSKSYFFK